MKGGKSKTLQENKDIKNAISDYQGIENNETSLNDSYTTFVNSNSIPEALIRAAANVPDGLIRSIVWKYVKLINSILSAQLFALGVELGSTDEEIKEQAKDAVKNVKTLTKISLAVLNNPEVKENVKQLAIDLNNSVLRPFLEVSLVTLDSLSPQIDRSSDKLAGRIHNGVRKLTDSVGNGVLSGLGTVPYVGNILNATDTIANTLLGVQSVVDESLGAMLDQTLETLTILEEIGGPANKALRSWVNFAKNANDAMKNTKNQWDKISANAQNKTFIPDNPISTEQMMERRQQINRTDDEKPTKPIESTDVDMTQRDSMDKKEAAAAAGGGARKKRKKRRKKKTKKKNQKKRTKHKSRRRK